MKTKIKFSDIAGMLERDEMKEIVGGCGNGHVEVHSNFYGLPDSLSDFYMQFGGGAAIGSNFGGQSYSGYDNALINNFNAKSAEVYTTTDPKIINQMVAMLTGNFGNLPPGILSSPIPGTTDEFLGEKLREVIVGNNSSGAEALGAVAFGWDMKTMLSQIAVGENPVGFEAQYIKYLEWGSKVGLGASAGLIAYDAINKGAISDYHVADIGTQALIYGTATAVPVAGWALGAAYFLANYYTEHNYGQGLYEHLSSTNN
jgi:hypothetical protein